MPRPEAPGAPRSTARGIPRVLYSAKPRPHLGLHPCGAVHNTAIMGDDSCIYAITTTFSDLHLGDHSISSSFATLSTTISSSLASLQPPQHLRALHLRNHGGNLEPYTSAITTAFSSSASLQSPRRLRPFHSCNHGGNLEPCTSAITTASLDTDPNSHLAGPRTMLVFSSLYSSATAGPALAHQAAVVSLLEPFSMSRQVRTVPPQCRHCSGLEMRDPARHRISLRIKTTVPLSSTTSSRNLSLFNHCSFQTVTISESQFPCLALPRSHSS